MTALRPRVAYFSPLPPDPSGIADYSDELLPYLDERWEVDLFVDGYRPSSDAVKAHRLIDCAATDPVPQLAEYDAVVYHVGNSESHNYIYDTLMRFPGLVVLHELSLQHSIAKRTVGEGRKDLYMKEMRENHGSAGAERARRALFGSEMMPWDSDPLTYPLNRRVLASATGVLVFSRFVEDAIAKVYPDLYVSRVEQHAAPIPEEALTLWQERLDATDAAAAGQHSPGAAPVCRFVTAGNLTPTKCVELTIRALSRLQQRVPIEYRLIGRTQLAGDIEAQIRQHGLEGKVKIEGRVTDDELYHGLASADVCVCLRKPTLGETSAIAMRALACGVPLVVSEDGWFRELPDSIALKVAVGGREDRGLERALEALARDPARRRAMSEAARDFAKERTPSRSAEDYDAFVRKAGFFRRRWVGRGFHRLCERYRELDLEYAGVAAKDRAVLVAEMSDWKNVPLKRWRDTNLGDGKASPDRDPTLRDDPTPTEGGIEPSSSAHSKRQLAVGRPE